MFISVLWCRISHRNCNKSSLTLHYWHWCTLESWIFHVLLALVHPLVMNVFKGSINLKLLCPGEWLEFKSQPYRRPKLMVDVRRDTWGKNSSVEYIVHDIWRIKLEVVLRLAANYSSFCHALSSSACHCCHLLLHRFFKIPMDLLPKIRSSSEVYGFVADGVLKGVPISGVSK